MLLGPDRESSSGTRRGSMRVSCSSAVAAGRDPVDALNDQLVEVRVAERVVLVGTEVAMAEDVWKTRPLPKVRVQATGQTTP